MPHARGIVLQFLINPPGWFPLAAAVAGVLLIWWDIIRRSKLRKVTAHEGAVSDTLVATDTVDATVVRPSQASQRNGTIPIPWWLFAVVVVFVIVGLSLLMWSPSHKPQLSPSTQKADAPRTGEVARPAPPREFIDFDYPALIRRLENLNGIQAQQVYGLYIGKWARVTAQLGSLRDYPLENTVTVVARMQGISGGRAYLVLSFSSKWKSQLSLMSAGDTITATCQISDFFPDGLHLKECELP